MLEESSACEAELATMDEQQQLSVAVKLPAFQVFSVPGGQLMLSIYFVKHVLISEEINICSAELLSYAVELWPLSCTGKTAFT